MIEAGGDDYIYLPASFAGSATVDLAAVGLAIHAGWTSYNAGGANTISGATDSGGTATLDLTTQWVHLSRGVNVDTIWIETLPGAWSGYANAYFTAAAGTLALNADGTIALPTSATGWTPGYLKADNWQPSGPTWIAGYMNTLTVTTDGVPEPGSLALLGLAAGVVARRRRRAA